VAESQFIGIARELLQGKKVSELTLNRKEYKFSDKQAEFISDMNGEHKFQLFSGGRGCGKSLALCVKIYLMCKGFPGIRVLLGRKNLSDIEKTTLQDLFRLMPPQDFEYRVKDGLINFRNGSQVVLMGLDAMQSGNIADMKKAAQKTKSLNIGAYFLDQLEEIEWQTFQALNDTMRMRAAEVNKLTPEQKLLGNIELFKQTGILDFPRVGSMTTNPANFWAYHYFKLNQRMDDDGNWLQKTSQDTVLWEGSMLDNKENLPPDFIKDRMSREESWVRRYVYGEWNMDVLTKGAVFAKEHIMRMETYLKVPFSKEEGCEIYEPPVIGEEYRMGIDPSEGVVDPSSISVVSSRGKKVAKFNGMVPIQALADKAKFLYYKYYKPLIIPERNSAGTALIREIRDLKVYREKKTQYKTDIETEKLGFRTSWDSKQELIDHFQKLLRNNSIMIFDKKTIEEMKTFIWSDEATNQGAGAQRGFHDDDIMSTMLAYWDWTPLKSEIVAAARAKPITKRSFQYV
jgi:hypothetical protein